MIYVVTTGDCATTATFAGNLGIHNRNVDSNCEIPGTTSCTVTMR